MRGCGVAGFAPFPQSALHIGWNIADGGECDLEVRFENEGWTAQGTLGTDRAQFVMRMSATLIVSTRPSGSWRWSPPRVPHAQV